MEKVVKIIGLHDKFHSILSLTFILGMISPISTIAQQNDTTDIEQAIENYIIGWRTGDSTRLKKAFDLDEGVVFWVDKSGDSEQLKSMKLSALVGRGKTQEGYGIGYKIQSLEIIDGQLAVAIVKIPRKDSHYIDCLELQKLNGDWKIVLKSFVYFPGK